MARAKTTVRGRAPLARDSQQWMLDYLIQETGRVFHFQGEGRGRLPRRGGRPERVIVIVQKNARLQFTRPQFTSSFVFLAL